MSDPGVAESVRTWTAREVCQRIVELLMEHEPELLWGWGEMGADECVQDLLSFRSDQLFVLTVTDDTLAHSDGRITERTDG